ncbi:MAG: hypothetical protein EXR69_03930 [Myxococcales bacterium]|nr:hypothetical protein [Myxococcales bacterium]
MLILLLLACPTPFAGDDTSGGPGVIDDPDTGADTGADTGPTDAEDDARVRALTDLPEGDEPSAPPLLIRVDYVVDGDTFYCTPDGTFDSVKVRMIGVDTPEIAHGDAAECYGNEAWAYTGAALNGRLAWLTFDAEELDDYGRTLAYVIRDTTEAGFYNRRIVRDGYAIPLEIAPDDSYAAEIQADANAAEADGLGLWAACP